MERWGGSAHEADHPTRPIGPTTVPTAGELDGCRHPRARPRQRAGARLRAAARPSAPRSRSPWPSWASPDRAAAHDRRRAGHGHRPPDRGAPAARPPQGARHDAQRHRRRRRRPRSTRPRPPRPAWRALSFDDRAADPAQGRRAALRSVARTTLNAATMLGQSKTAYQAEIDAACELIDFWRFNVHFARQILDRAAAAQRQGHLEPHATTARSRASSTRSRRSTSPRSPATCRPRRR